MVGAGGRSHFARGSEGTATDPLRAIENRYGRQLEVAARLPASLAPWFVRCRAARQNCWMDFRERAGHNEEIFREVNERIEEGAEQHGVTKPLPFHCECGRSDCVETIEIEPGEYDRVASHVARFVLLPGHEEASIESVVERTPAYLIVEKFGEARKEVEREHPRRRHR
jgi:hypothetical protein